MGEGIGDGKERKEVAEGAGSMQPGSFYVLDYGSGGRRKVGTRGGHKGVGTGFVGFEGATRAGRDGEGGGLELTYFIFKKMGFCC